MNFAEAFANEFAYPGVVDLFNAILNSASAYRRLVVLSSRDPFTFTRSQRSLTAWCTTATFPASTPYLATRVFHLTSLLYVMKCLHPSIAASTIWKFSIKRSPPTREKPTGKSRKTTSGTHMTL